VAKETKCPSTAITNLFMHKKDREICTTLGTGLDLTLSRLSTFGVHVLGVEMGGFVSGVSIQVTDVTIQQAARSTVLVVIYQGSTV